MNRTLTLFGLAALVTLGMGAPATAQRSWDGGNGTFVWGDFGNWSPDGNPNGVALSIGNLAAAANDTTLIDAAYTITSLTISDGADVVTSTDNGATNDFSLTVNGLTTISDAGSTFFVIGADVDGLDTEGLTINSGGALNLNSTTAQGTAVVEIESGVLDVNAGGTIIGQGRIELDVALGAPTNALINDGTITANTPNVFIFQGPATGTLQIVALDADARFDWDGVGGGVLQVNGNQTLDIDVQPGVGAGADPFSGTMNLGTGSTIDVAHAWSLDTGAINANTAAFGPIIIGQDPNPGPAAHIAGAAWTMTGGTINVGDTWDSLEFDSALTASAGVVNNAGTMIFDAAATFQSGVDFNMNSPRSSLVVNATVNIDTPDFALDGAGAMGTTTIGDNGILDLDLGVGADLFLQHTININGGELDVTTSAATSWTIAGTLNAGGGVTSTVNSAGETLTITGGVNVTGAGTILTLNPAVVFTNPTVAIGAGSRLNMAATTYNGGSYTGDGQFFKGTATIDAPTTWAVATVVLDNGNTTLNANLTINATALSTTSEGVDGLITIANAAELAITVTPGTWTLDPSGFINYTGDAAPDSYLSGSDIVVNGTINNTGDGSTLARLDIGATGVVNILTAGQPFRLSGGNNTNDRNTIAGGTINGPGILAADALKGLSGFGVINANIDFDGASDLVAQGGLLDINGTITDLGTLRTSGATAVIDFATPFTTNVTDDGLHMAGGTVQGAAVTTVPTKSLRGFGTVTSAVDNNGTIESQGGTLIIDNAASDWDGTAGNVGRLQAFSGTTLELRDAGGFNFQGTMQTNGGEIFANGWSVLFQPASTLDLSGGGVFRANTNPDFGGAIDVAGSGGVVRGPINARFVNGAAVTLDGDLTLDTDLATVFTGATFSGGGALVNGGATVLRLDDGADVDVLLENRSSLQLGTLAAAGQTQGLDFEQTADGDLRIRIGGTGLNDFDRMNLTGAAQLAGTLDLGLIGAFVPTLGQTFNILSATGGISGAFTAVNQPATMPAGLFFDVVYTPTIVQLAVINAPIFTADFDVDGDVDGDDLTQWEGDFGVNDLSDADNDGDSDGTDFLTWQQQIGSMPAVAAAMAVPEPPIASLTWVMLAVGMAMATRCVAARSRTLAPR